MSQELRNCAEEATGRLREASFEEAARIASALDAGKFVVVCDSPWHCRATDAVVGTLRSLVAEYGTRAEAEAEVQSRYSQGDDDRYEVLPSVQVQPVTAPADDGLPF